MNFVFSAIIVASVCVLLAVNPDGVFSSLLSGAGSGIEFAVKLLAVYTVWLSILKIWEKLKFNSFFAKKSAPLLGKLFPEEDEKCYSALSVNLSANVLGMGSAGTPAGISAVKNMKSLKNRTMLIVINSTSIQLIPTTIVAMRSTQNASTDIVLPTLISTLVSTAIGIILVKLFVKK